MKTLRPARTSRPTLPMGLSLAMVLLGTQLAPAQVFQHPQAARRIHIHRVHTHRQNVAGAVQDRRQNVAGAIQDRRENVGGAVQERADNARDRRTAAAAARAVLPRYAPATIASSGSIVCPPGPAPVTLPPPAEPPPATVPPPDGDAYDGIESDELDDPFEGSPSYPVARIEEGGTIVVLKVGSGETKIRLVGVTAISLEEKVNLPERFAGLRLPSTERFLDNLLRGESVYVVYDTGVAESDADKNCVAYLFRAPDGLQVNLELVRSGFAATDSRYDFYQKDTFSKYQDSARRSGKGIYGLIQRINAAKAEKQQK